MGLISLINSRILSRIGLPMGAPVIAAVTKWSALPAAILLQEAAVPCGRHQFLPCPPEKVRQQQGQGGQNWAVGGSGSGSDGPRRILSPLSAAFPSLQLQS